MTLATNEINNANSFIKVIDWYRESFCEEQKNNHIEVLFFERGEGTILIDKCKYPVVAGSIYLFNANIGYSYQSKGEEPFSIIRIGFDAKFIRENLSNTNFINDCYEYEFREDMASDYKKFCFIYSTRFISLATCGHDNEEYMKNIFYEYKNKKRGYISLVRKQVEIVLINIFRDFVFGKPNHLTHEQKVIVEEFISKLKEEGYVYDDIENIIKETGYCKLHFNRIFKEYSGVTISQYIKKKRIELAKHLLTETDKSIEEICTEVGYNDIANFYQIFKSATGISPRQFSKRNKRN
jgi:AraC-like DNA-binding protein